MIDLNCLWDHLRPHKYNILFSGGGSPIPSVHSIMHFLNEAPFVFDGKIIWKSNFTENSYIYEIFPADLWVQDFKFGNDECALKLSGIKKYWKLVLNNFNILCRRNEPIIIRHLLLPGHLHCCTARILSALSAFKNKVLLSINPDFIPEYRSLEFGLARLINDKEKDYAYSMATRLGFHIIT